MSITAEQEIAAFHATEEGRKALDRDATLLAELDRLAADYDLTADMCLSEIIKLQAERGGAVAIAIMAEEINHAWRRFKMGSQHPGFRALRRTHSEAMMAADGEP